MFTIEEVVQLSFFTDEELDAMLVPKVIVKTNLGVWLYY